MANPKESIWGASSTWIYSKKQAGLETTAAKLGNFDKPRTANFGTGSSADYEGALVRAINVAHTMTLNQYLDESICPCGQAPDVSPFGKVALMNENKNFSPTPSSIYTTDKPVNWFFADIPANISFTPYVFYRDYGRLKYQQFAPKAFTTVNSAIAPMNLVPYVKWGLRSLVLSIEVGITANANNPITGAQTWVTLDDWKNNYSSTHYVNGMRLFVRGCTAINSTTLKLTYNNERNISTGQRGALAILNKFNILNDGANVDTQFLALNRIGFSCAYIFDKTPRLFNEGGSSGANDRAFMPAYHYFENQTIEFYREDSTTGYYYYKIPYSESNYNKFMQIAALFGCFFTPTNKYVFDYDMLDTDLYLPIIDENGVAHGQYTKGADNANNSLYTKNSIRDIDYDPDAPPSPVDPNTYSNTTGFNSLSSGASATIKYVLDSSNVRQLLTDLWTISHTIAGADYENYDYKILDSFLVSNPIDSIVSLKRFPFDIPHTFSSQKTNVCLGKNTGSSQGYVTHNVFNTVVFSGIPVYAKFGNSFLDYAPYTEYELYIPFCGSVKLNAGDILGHTLNCRLQIDLTTGSCTAYILADDLVIETATGVVSCELQVAGTDSATVDSAIQNAVINHIGARTNKEIAMLSPLTFGGLLSAVSNPVKTSGAMENANNEISRADYNLTHIQTPVHAMGNAGGLTGWYQEFNARLIIYYPEGEAIDSSAPVSSTYPKLADLTDYAHNVGFACVMNGTVSEFHGKTVGNIDTSSIVGATEEERAQIKALFAQGVWLP